MNKAHMEPIFPVCHYGNCRQEARYRVFDRYDKAMGDYCAAHAEVQVAFLDAYSNAVDRARA